MIEEMLFQFLFDGQVGYLASDVASVEYHVIG